MRRKIKNFREGRNDRYARNTRETGNEMEDSSRLIRGESGNARGQLLYYKSLDEIEV